MNELSITLIQSTLFWKNIQKNLDHFTKLINKIEKTNIILLPEMFNTAFCPDEVSLAEEMQGKTINWMKKIALNNACSVVGTLMVQEKNKIFNRLVWVSENGQTQFYDKRHLFSFAEESQTITKGEKRLILLEKGWKICPLICYDLRFPVFSRNNIDYDILIYLANWPNKRINSWDTLLKARSIENQCYTIGVNRIGEDGNNILFSGHSKIIDPLGNEIASTNTGEEEILTTKVTKEILDYQRNKMNFLQDRDNFSLH